MDEVLYDAAGNAPTHHTGHQVEVKVLDHHQRRRAGPLDLAHGRLGKRPVDRNVAIFPGPGDAADHSVARQVAPHLVL